MNFDKFNAWAMENGHPDLENIKEGNEKLRKNVLRPRSRRRSGRAKKPAKTIEPKEAGEKKSPKKVPPDPASWTRPTVCLPASSPCWRRVWAPSGMANLSKKKIDVRGYYASEKFDGYRAIWDGEKFISRTSQHV